MKYRILPIFLSVAACAELGQVEPIPAPESDEVEVAAAPPPPPPTARTVEQFDTTTDAQREAAATPETGGELLGSTVASLGDAASPGFWIETPLTETVGTGRVVYQENGKEVEVELRPAPDGTSRVSLATLRLLDAPLTELVTLDVYRN